MFKEMSQFQLIFTGIFAGALIAGVLIFSMYRGAGGGAVVEPVTIWGTMSDGQFATVFKNSGLQDDSTVVVTYVHKDPSVFEQSLVEALAEGAGPDAILVSQDQIFKQRKRIFPIPYANLDARTFKDTYVQEAELFMDTDGVLAIPFMMDPHVMFWNRNIFQTAALSQPPKYWDEFFNLVGLLTKKDGALNITQATVGLGEYKNVTHAKQLISLLIMQAGNPITMSREGRIESVLIETFDNPYPPAEAAVNYYTEFSNPSKDSYTWNRSLPDSKQMFISGDLATYFGPASELFEIQDKNPNLNFDVTYIPQSRDAKNRLTFGTLTGLAILKTSQHVAAAFKVISVLTSTYSLSALSSATGLPPVRRDMLAQKPTNSYGTVFYDSAIYAKGWTDPNYQETNKIFQELIESITSGRARPLQAIGTAHTAMYRLFDPAGINYTPPIQAP